MSFSGMELRALGWVNFWDLNPIALLTGKPISLPSKRAIVFSCRNLNRRVSLDEAAQAAHVSPCHLERKLHEEMGLGFHAWHAGGRVGYAKRRMMVYGDTPTQAMLAAGFEDYAEFSHTFKTYDGVSPREFWVNTASKQTPWERIRLRRRTTKWQELARLLLLIHEGKVTEKRLARVRELDREVGTRVYIRPLEDNEQAGGL
jgi:AraC-like DNA-binding protein